MTTLAYADAMSEALDRLRDIGYEHGSVLVNHAPMAAEALATLRPDEVHGWVEYNLGARRYNESPGPRWALSSGDASDWRAALGTFSRVADWQQMFATELDEHSW